MRRLVALLLGLLAATGFAATTGAVIQLYFSTDPFEVKSAAVVAIVYGALTPFVGLAALMTWRWHGFKNRWKAERQQLRDSRR